MSFPSPLLAALQPICDAEDMVGMFMVWRDGLLSQWEQRQHRWPGERTWGAAWGQCCLGAGLLLWGLLPIHHAAPKEVMGDGNAVLGRGCAAQPLI